MQYTSAAEVEEALAAGTEDLVVLDVRQDADHRKDGIPGSYGADMHAANKRGDLEDGREKMRATLLEATGSGTSNGERIVLVCYSGNTYAQVATNVLDSMGVDLSNVYTLEGGMQAWGSRR